MADLTPAQTSALRMLLRKHGKPGRRDVCQRLQVLGLIEREPGIWCLSFRLTDEGRRIAEAAEARWRTTWAARAAAAPLSSKED